MQNVPNLAAVLLFATCSWAQPHIFSVFGAADYANAGTVGIPQGSIFAITGVSLTTPTKYPVPPVIPTGPTLRTDVSGVSVGIRTLGNSKQVIAQAPLLYVSSMQVNAILPSSVPVGQYEVYLTTLSSAGSAQAFDSNPLPILVTGGRFAPFTRQGRGFGPAAIQEYDTAGTLTLNQFTASASPGSIMALYGTGLGALPTGSDASPPPIGTIRNDITVYVAGIPVKPLYAGRAPSLFGVDQINFVLPTGMEGCYVPVQVSRARLKVPGSQFPFRFQGIPAQANSGYQQKLWLRWMRAAQSLQMS